MRRKIVSSVQRIHSVLKSSWWKNANKVIYQETEIIYYFIQNVARWDEGILIDFHAKFYRAKKIPFIQPSKWHAMYRFVCCFFFIRNVYKFKSRSSFIRFALHNEFHRFLCFITFPMRSYLMSVIWKIRPNTVKKNTTTE